MLRTIDRNDHRTTCGDHESIGTDQTTPAPCDAGLRRSISGVRGTAASLSEAAADRYACAFGTYLRQLGDTNTIVVGRDTRPTSHVLLDRVARALQDGGWDVIDLGVVPTPTAQLAIAQLHASGGVVVTASHNPVTYNGLKFLQNCEGHGMFLREAQIREVFRIHDAGVFDTRRRGTRTPIAEFAAEFHVRPYTADYLARARGIPVPDNAIILDYHLDRIIRAMGKDLDRIRARNLRVAMDCCGGAGIPINYVLLDYFYARVTAIGDTPGAFTREIEPTPNNLEGLCRTLDGEFEPYNVVFVTDCDNDRCVLVARDADSGRYSPLEEDYTFAIAVDRVLGDMPEGQTVVTNWSTSQMIKDICSAHHANLRRVPTGEVYTASDAMHFHAALAGEGSCAGVIDPRVGMGRDTLVAMWHVLAALAHEKRDLMGMVRAYPRYEKSSRNHRGDTTPESVRATIEHLQRFYARRSDLAFMSREDGLIVAFEDGSRLHVRPSNTEPILRIRSWSRDQSAADMLLDEAIGAIQDVYGARST